MDADALPGAVPDRGPSPDAANLRGLGGTLPAVPGALPSAAYAEHTAAAAVPDELRRC